MQGYPTMTWRLDASNVGLMKPECLALSYRNIKNLIWAVASLPPALEHGWNIWGKAPKSLTAALGVCIIPA